MSYRGKGNDPRGRGRGAGGRGGPRGASPNPSRGGSPRGPSPANRGGNPSRGGRGGPPFHGGGGGSRGGQQGGFGGPRGGHGGGSGFTGPPRGGGRGGPPSNVPLIFAADRPAVEDNRLSTLDSLVTSFQKLKVGPKDTSNDEPEMPLRPGFGKLGNPITLRANFFPVRLPKQPIYDYSVSITPKPKRDEIEEVFNLLEQSAAYQPYAHIVAHDKNQRLVAGQELPAPIDVEVVMQQGEGEARRKVFVVSIELTRELDPAEMTRYMAGQTEFRDYDPLPLVSALNLVMQQHARRIGVPHGGANERRTGAKRMFFDTEKTSLSLGIDAWRGYFTSVRPVYKQLMVNVNVCVSAFYYPGRLADAVDAFQRQSKGAIPYRFIDGLKVTTQYLGYRRKMTVKRIASQNARQYKFKCDELGGEVSVEEYYRRKYKIKLQRPNEPLIEMDTAKKDRIPVELCEIPHGLPFVGTLSEPETQNMLRFAARRPAENATSIVHTGLPLLGLVPPESPIDSFGLSISAEMAVIPARELPPPNIAYGGTKTIRPAAGSWNILQVRFQKPSRVERWWVLLVVDEQELPDLDGMKDLASTFQRKLESSGVSMPREGPTLLRVKLVGTREDPSRVRAVAQIKDMLQGNIKAQGRKPNLTLVLLSKRDPFIYPGIKRLCDMELGMHTVHMQLSKAMGDPRKQDQYMSNVALKVNTKLGGLNHRVEPDAMRWLTKERTMMIGVDVAHPGPKSKKGSPSIAAVVASVDDTFVQFPASIRIQHTENKEAKEMVTDLTEMVVERLQLYEKKNKVLPQRVYVFRDGVSEGQYKVLLLDELPKLREAFRRMNTQSRGTYKPKLSVIICGKRHHARFYPTSSQFADKNGNTRPGTVVDRGITAIFDFDFYLQAHAGLQGTVRPTHYVVVYDENSLNADEVQAGTHAQSYLWARATKAVSLVPPAYYADIACERGRLWLSEFMETQDASESASEGGSTGGMRGRGRGRGGSSRGGGPGRGGDIEARRREERERVFAAAQRRWGDGLHPDLRESMFFI